MRATFVTFAAVLSFISSAYAKPGGSPLCLVDGAAEKLTAGMGANKGKIDCAITADKTSYTPGASVTLSWDCKDIDNFQGFLAYASGNDNKKVGAFTLMDGLKSNKPACGDTAEQDNSVVTHSAPGKFSPKGSITYTAPAADAGPLSFNFLVVKKVDGGFRWGIFSKAVTITSPSGTSGAESTPGVDAFSCMCPTPAAISLIKKCTPKNNAGKKVVMTKFKTKLETMTETKVKTEVKTEKVKVTATCPQVAGGEATPSSTNAYGGGYGGGYGATPTQGGSYGSYSVKEVKDDEDEDVAQDDADEE